MKYKQLRSVLAFKIIKRNSNLFSSEKCFAWLGKKLAAWRFARANCGRLVFKRIVDFGRNDCCAFKSPAGMLQTTTFTGQPPSLSYCHFLSTSGMDEIQKSLSLDTCFSTSLQFHFLTASFTCRHTHKWCIFSHMPPADVYTHIHVCIHTQYYTHTHSAVGMHLSPIIAFFVSLSQLADSYRAKHNSLTLLRYWRTKLELPYNYVLSQSKVKSLDISEVQWHKNDVLAGVHYIVFSEPGRSMRSCIMN